MLDSRADVMAALGDPTRLAIADVLAIGDRASGELARELDLPGNLLAHHVNVLAQAGVVERIRSEGDRRRSYVRLGIDEPLVSALLIAGAIGTRPLGAVTRVVFVCTHNSARSQLAAAAWERCCDVPAASAGTQPATDVHPGAIAAGRRHDLDLSKRRTAHVDDVVRAGDLVVAVCDNAYETSLTSPRTDVRKPLIHWSVPDPVRSSSAAAFEAVVRQITVRVDRLGRAVTASHGRRPA